MKPNFAITIGDPCGIGPEIVIKAIHNYPEINEYCNPVVIGDMAIIKKTVTLLKSSIKIEQLENLEKLHTKPGSIYCLSVQPTSFDTVAGKICADAGIHAFHYLKTAISLALKKNIHAIITAPINKEALRMGKVPYLDHTEILTKLTASKNTMTLFVTGSLRTFFYSRHIPFREIADSIKKDKIVTTLGHCCRYLKQIRIAKPRIAVAALNPHAGEQGMFGDEEIREIIPAVKEAKQKGMDVHGPIAADSVYHLAKEGHFDAVLSLYHDQGHIATKTLDFHRTVSLTMGLPFLRTSVDHGTAMDIAGKGIASEVSLVEAIKAAKEYYWK
jgi:4-hydroxythreonine-4-phosphate dehydrogenase